MMNEAIPTKDENDESVTARPADTGPSPRRRRLIKAAVAAPSVFTLYSGAALARSSNMVGTTDDVDRAIKTDNGDLACFNGELNEYGGLDLGNTVGYDAYTMKRVERRLKRGRRPCANGGHMVAVSSAASLRGMI